MSDNKLKSYLKERLDNYERSVDDALWFSSIKEIDKRKRRRRARLYAVGIGAAMTIFALLFLPLLREHEKDTIKLALHEETFAKKPNTDNSQIRDKIETERQPENILNLQTVASPHKKDAIVDAQTTIDTQKAVEEPEDYKATEPESNKEVITEKEIPISHDTKRDTVTSAGPDNSNPESDKNNLYRTQPVKRQDKQKRGLSLLLAANEIGSISLPEKREASYSAGWEHAAIIGNREEIVYDFPVSFGIKIRKGVASRFAIESGLTYTYLHTYTNKERKDIKLHYIGVPLKGVYTISDSRSFSFYGSIGGMVEKQVYGVSKQPTGEIALKNSNLQWSLSASTGVNYRLGNLVGLFAEPGVSYFFNDGSNIPTIRKDNPLNFSFQIGLSFNIK